MSDSQTPIVTATAPVTLEYGARPRRWRLRAWMTRTLLGIAAVMVLLIGLPRLNAYLARRAAWASIVAWHSAAGSFVVPPGTVMYDESTTGVVIPSTFNFAFQSIRGRHVRAGRVNSAAYPLLRQVGFQPEGLAVLLDVGVYYIHAHPMWDAQGGSKPFVIAVSDYRLDPTGRPEFATLAYGSPANGPDHWTRMGSYTTVQTPPTRAISNMRIFAGVPDPTDPTRFALPFACDGGTGRFEFQTDIDVSDGGKLSPDAQMVWNPPVATQPASMP